MRTTTAAIPCFASSTRAAIALLAVSISACGSSETGALGTGGTTTTTTPGGGGAGGDTNTGATAGGGTGGTAGATGGTGGTTTAGGGASGDYPAGPYGYDLGSTITNYEFIGFPQPQNSLNMAEIVSLGDFYNPTGSETYPAGSPYGEGNSMPKVLLIHAAAVWAGPSNYEADQIIPPALASYAPCLQVMEVLEDGPTPGNPATVPNAYSWASKYNSTYPVVTDPSFQLEPVFTMAAYPTNILIDTQTMKILDVLTGAPDDTYFTTKVQPICQ